MSDELNQQSMDQVVDVSAADAARVQEDPEVGAATEATPADEVRPWHGADNPLEALFQWAQAEFAKLRPAA